jgi:hypothetical protein
MSHIRFSKIRNAQGRERSRVRKWSRRDAPSGGAAVDNCKSWAPYHENRFSKIRNAQGRGRSHVRKWSRRDAPSGGAACFFSAERVDSTLVRVMETLQLLCTRQPGHPRSRSTQLLRLERQLTHRLFMFIRPMLVTLLQQGPLFHTCNLLNQKRIRPGNQRRG